MIRPMRGQCVVRELPWQRPVVIWTPDPEKRSVTWYRGRVLALGAPALLEPNTPGSPEVPWDIKVGDVVVYGFVHNKDAHTRAWSDGEAATWIPQGYTLTIRQ